jgi:hypothetical protein
LAAHRKANREPRHGLELRAVRRAPMMILAPRHFVRVGVKAASGYAMMDAYLGAPRAAEIAFGLIPHRLLTSNSG